MTQPAVLIDNAHRKIIAAPDFHFVFNKDTGFRALWGRTQDDDPQWSPYGPELADIEISRDGCPGFGSPAAPKLCRYCYKENTARPAHNMTLEQFKHVLDLLGPQLTQVAFGITGVKTNPDFIAMMEYCREKGVIPNFTLTGADLDDDFTTKIAPLVGACAVSFHGDTELCFSTIERLHRAGVKQINIHAVTVDSLILTDLMFDIYMRRRQSPDFQLNAVVLLSLKPKGRAKHLKCISQEELAYIVRMAQDFDINVGFDSCSAHKAFEMYPPEMHHMIEPCESGLFSIYVDADCVVHPCSFAEGTCTDVPIDLNVIQVTNFLEEVWNAPTIKVWRENLLEGDRRCPLSF